jgi:hypothetical protein
MFQPSLSPFHHCPIFNRLSTGARAKAAMPHTYSLGLTGYKQQLYLLYRSMGQQETSAVTSGYKKVICIS